MWSTAFDVGLTALVAMGRILLLSAVGYFAALYPSDSPLLPPSTVKILSRISNVLFLPSLCVVALGKGLSAELFVRMSIIIPLCVLNEIVAYALSFTVGKFMHEDNKRLYTAISVAIASPNVVSFPLMIMDTLCKQSDQIQQDFESAESCFVEATSVIFVYSIGWQTIFWGYGFPRLQTLLDDSSVNEARESTKDSSLDPWAVTRAMALELFESLQLLITRLVSSPVLQAISLGIVIGVSKPIQNALFVDFTGLTPVGSTLQTLADPVICVNALIMSSSLAAVTVFPEPPLDEQGNHDLSQLTFSAKMAYFLKSKFSQALVFVGLIAPRPSNNAKNKKTSFSDTSIDRSGESEDIGIEMVEGTDFDRDKRTMNKVVASDEYAVESFRHNNAFEGYSTDGISIHIAGQRRSRSHTEPNLGYSRIKFQELKNSERKSKDDHGLTVAAVSRESEFPSSKDGKISISTEGESDGKTDEGALEGSPLIITPPQMRTVMAMLLCRLVFSPLIVIPIAHALFQGGLIKYEDRVFLLIVILESAAPSAQLMIVALSQLGVTREASQLAYCYIFQYTFSIITVTIVTIIGIMTLYD